MLVQKLALVILLGVLCLAYSPAYESVEDTGTLDGDVQNWAVMIQNYISQLASDGIKRDITQGLLDQANYTYEKKDGAKIVTEVRKQLSTYFATKKAAAARLAKKIQTLYDDFLIRNVTVPPGSKLGDLPLDVYWDSDVPGRLPKDTIQFDSKFRRDVSRHQSTMKISDEVPRTLDKTIHAVNFSSKLDEVFQKNLNDDTTMRWQYFGSTAGVFRLFPGREWDTNFAGFYNDYDPRTRPWYIAATSGPKDVIIILDCSLSMADNGKFTIAQAVAKIVINTLTKQDFVNVICARASHWDEVGKWHYFSTDVLSCQQDKLVAATNAHRKDLMSKIERLKPQGTSELDKGFDVAFQLLQGTSRTGCQSLIVLITDGKDTDGESVRCGPGYYTRSGYVPGPVCKYNWNKIWSLVKERNAKQTPPTRIFSYLTKDEGEAFPGKLACENRGSMKKLHTGENLISEMSNYFNFLSSIAITDQGLWTSPYLDNGGLGVMVTHAIPIVSNAAKDKKDQKLPAFGVIGVDCTLDEIEFSMARYQWGSVYSFLINKEGETIFHPLMKPSSNLKEDPIFIPIFQLEKEKNGGKAPTNFSIVEAGMREGKIGSLNVTDGRQDFTYFYAALNDSEFGFAFSLTPTDKEYRRSLEPVDKSRYKVPNRKSYFNLLIEYNSTKAREELPEVFPYLQVKYNEDKYPSLRVSYLHSSIFLAPKCHCDSKKYFYDDDLAQKTVDAHKWINGDEPDLGCDSDQKYEKGIRADVLITQPIEEEWIKRNFEALDKVKWTYVGLRSGVFRTYPGHRSTREYDPTARPWYKRASRDPSKTSISTPYMDAAGVGKIITISQALYEGMTAREMSECRRTHGAGPYPGGCLCDVDNDCISGSCYVSKGPGPNRDKRRCATERVEGVTSLDILYTDFHKKIMTVMQSSDMNGSRSCGAIYKCPNGSPGCQTRCYLFDNQANMIVDPDFVKVKDMETGKYAGITMGKKEGEIMRELIFKHKFFVRTDSVEFQGTCSIAGGEKVTLKGLPSNPEEKDNYYKTKGPIPKFSNNYGCIQDLVSFKANPSALGKSGMIIGNVSGPCMQGFYYVTALPKTNLFLLIIENWKNEQQGNFFNFNCRITQKIVNAGAYRIINGTCADEASTTKTLLEQNKCPQLRDVEIPCTYDSAMSNSVSTLLMLATMTVLCVVTNNMLR